MQKATQHITRFKVITPKTTSSEDIVSVINAIKNNTINVPTSQTTYEIRRKKALPFFRMFTVPSKQNKKTFDLYGKNIFRLFQG